MPETTPRDLRKRLREAMIADRGRLRARIRDLERQGARDARLAEAAGQVERSAERRRRRAESIPPIVFPPTLPVSAHADEIASLVRDHQAIVVCGETGSGKTTQLPKILLSMGLGAAGLIGHTQPRRLAARSVAARIAEEVGVPLGRQIGSKVRFSDRTGKDTLVKVMTDGVLLSEMQSDRDLEAYEAIIIDEAHERSLNIDFILGYTRRLLAKRSDLKVIVTSATIDPQRFAEHYATDAGPAPIVEVSGRTYPVEVRYRPPRAQADHEQDLEHLDALQLAVDELSSEGHGDILVFEPGEREIREAADALSRHCPPRTEILPLYGRLAHHEQDRVFAPHTGRRIVIATNVAETSLTVPGIRYVVDGGTARISRYSPNSKLQRLEIEPISQASAKQRAGRCGRVAEGVCIRLYEESDLAARPEFTAPEIHRSNLASVILQMKALRLGSIERFPFVEPPDPKRIRDGVDVLTELGALDAKGGLTDVGRALSRLPLDPRLGRMLIEADRLGCLAEVLIIVSVLSLQDPRERPFERRDEADAAHEQFKHADSDFLALLNLWRFYQDLDAKLGASRLRKACRQNFISYIRMREWRDTHRQLRLLLGAMGYHASSTPADEDAIHRALLPGLLDNLGRKNKDGEYEGIRNQKFAIFPGSGIAGKPQWIVAAEIVRTSRAFARTCARVNPEWIEAAVGDRLKRSYSEPQWDPKAGRIVAAERATYRGLVLHSAKQVHYGPIDPDLSRELFIRHALVDAELRPRPEFLEHNVALIEELRRLEAKTRSEGALVTDEACFRFYDARVPDDVHNAPRFRKWLKRTERDHPRVLHMRREDILPAGADLPDASLLPDASDALGVRLNIEYVHEPGRSQDGARVDVLIHELDRLDPAGEPWLIPAWLEERVRALLRSLPKTYRRRLDVPALSRAALATLRQDAGPLIDQLAALVRRETGVEIPRDQWDESKVPDHLRPIVRVIDDDASLLAEDRDVTALKRRLAGVAAERARSLGTGDYPRTGFTDWAFEDLPRTVSTTAGGRTIDAFPAIVDSGDAVALELRSDGAAAERETHAGVRRLAALALDRRGLLDLRSDSRLAHLTMLFAPLGDRATLVDELRLAIAERALDLNASTPRTRAAFEDRLAAADRTIESATDHVLDTAGAILTERQAVALALEQKTPPAWADSIADMRTQLAALVTPRFLTATPAEWLAHVPRFERGILKRLEKLRNAGLDRDRQRMRDLHPALAAFARRRDALGALAPTSPTLRRARWLVEELRISLFAQELRTSVPISLDRFLQALEQADRQRQPSVRATSEVS